MCCPDRQRDNVVFFQAIEEIIKVGDSSAKRQKRKSWYNFSIRSLLLLTVLVACGFAFILSHVKPMREERKAAMSLAGSGRIETEPAKWPTNWLGRYSPDGKTDHIIGIESTMGANVPEISSEELKNTLPKLPHLRHLNVEVFFEVNASVIAECEQLESLKMSNTAWTNEAIGLLANLKRLRKLTIESPRADWRATLPFLDREDFEMTLVTEDYEPSIRDREIESYVTAAKRHMINTEDINTLAIAGAKADSISRALRIDGLEWIVVDHFSALSPAAIMSIESSVNIELAATDDLNADALAAIAELFQPKSVRFSKEESIALSLSRKAGGETISLDITGLSLETVERLAGCDGMSKFERVDFRDSDLETINRLLAVCNGVQRIIIANSEFRDASELDLSRLTADTIFLHFNSCSKLKSFAYPLGCKAKELSLILNDCPRLETVENIGQTKNLHDFELYGMPKFSGFDDLKTCTTLDSIRLELCEKLESLSWVSAGVREISIASNSNLVSINRIGDLPELYYLKLDVGLPSGDFDWVGAENAVAKVAHQISLFRSGARLTEIYQQHKIQKK